MSEFAVWVVIVGLTCVTIATRSAFLVLGRRYTLPERLQHALRYAPVCALVALIAPELAFANGALALASPKLIAGAGAAVAMLVTRNMIVAMAVGMAAFTALRLVGG